jgi:catechol 2,3-dioxygenase-like lactoylglutathione lyase family enzyme
VNEHATVLQVPGVRAALAWFRDALGFEVQQYEDGTAYGYARRGGVSFHLACGPDPELWSAYVYVDDVEALHAELAERGAEIVQPPTDKGYGMRDLLVRGPGEHVIAFGQPLEQAPDRGPSGDR